MGGDLTQPELLKGEPGWLKKIGKLERHHIGTFSGCTMLTSVMMTMGRARSTVSWAAGTARRYCCEAGKIDFGVCWVDGWFKRSGVSELMGVLGLRGMRVEDVLDVENVNNGIP